MTVVAFAAYIFRSATGVDGQQEPSRQIQFMLEVDVPEIPRAEAWVAVIYQRHGARRHAMYAHGKFWHPLRNLDIVRGDLFLDGLSEILRGLNTGIHPFHNYAASCPRRDAAGLSEREQATIDLAIEAIAGVTCVIGVNLHVAIDEPVATLHVEKGNFLGVDVATRDDPAYMPSPFEAHNCTSFSLAQMDLVSEFRNSLARRGVAPPMPVIEVPHPELFDDDLERFAKGTARWLRGAVTDTGIGMENLDFLRAYRTIALKKGPMLPALSDLILASVRPEGRLEPRQKSVSITADRGLRPSEAAGEMLRLARARLEFQEPSLLERSDDYSLADLHF